MKFLGKLNLQHVLSFILICVVIAGLAFPLASKSISEPTNGEEDTSIVSTDISYSSGNAILEGLKGNKVSMGIDFGEPIHSEGIISYEAALKTVASEVVDSYKGLELFDSMYSFSVGVNEYTSVVKEKIKALGLFTELEDSTDNASYIVMHGDNSDKRVYMQLYCGSDGSQEVTITHDVSRGNLDSDLRFIESLFDDYLGIEVLSTDLNEFIKILETIVIPNGNHTLLVTDRDTQVHVQIAVSDASTEDEQWHFLGVKLVQDSLVNYEEETTGEPNSSEG